VPVVAVRGARVSTLGLMSFDSKQRWQMIQAWATFLLAFTAGAPPVNAAGSESDWRLYAFSRSGVVEFYSVPSVVRSPENETNSKRGTVKVWTEDLSLKALDNIRWDKQVVDLVSRRVVAYYLPPYFKSNAPPTDDEEFKFQLPRIIAFEELANRDKAPVKSVSLVELDCTNARLRILEAIDYRPGRVTKSVATRPSDWFYVPPHSVWGSLQTLVCDKESTAPDNTPAVLKPPAGK
jgi:hypothetical protein